jgi:predicted RNase H-like HicB family nuclease
MNVNANEIIFEVREAEEGGYNARSLGHSIFTQGDDLDDLRTMVKDAVACHFNDQPDRPKIICLHFVRDEVLTA